MVVFEFRAWERPSGGRRCVVVAASMPPDAVWERSRDGAGPSSIGGAWASCGRRCGLASAAWFGGGAYRSPDAPMQKKKKFALSHRRRKKKITYTI
jgi:hypothetical protein